MRPSGRWTSGGLPTQKITIRKIGKLTKHEFQKFAKNPDRGFRWCSAFGVRSRVSGATCDTAAKRRHVKARHGSAGTMEGTIRVRFSGRHGFSHQFASPAS